MEKNNNQTTIELKDLKVELVKGISQKNNSQYYMLRVSTGDVALDSTFKPIWLNLLQADLLEKRNNEK